MSTAVKFPMLLAAIVTCASCCGTSAAWAQEKIVSERQDAMKQQGRDLTQVRNWFQGKSEQPAAIAGIEAATKSLGKVPEWFPPGSGIGQVSAKTRAKPEIWQQNEKFLADQKTVLSQLAALDAAVKAGDKAKAETVFNEIKYCEACHSTFRAKAE